MAKPRAAEKFQEALANMIFVAGGDDMTDREIAEALRAQARATADFRSAMGELKEKVGTMQTGMHAYRDALDRTAVEIDRAVKKAKELQETAQRMVPQG